MVNAAEVDGVRIRPYQAADLSEVVALVRELQAYEGRIHDRMLRPDDIGPDYVDSMLAKCREMDGQLLVALAAHGRQVGYAVVLGRVTYESLDEVDYTYALVHDLAVKSEHRGCGIGRRLLGECETHARRVGARWLRIGVLAKNSAALALYEGIGFSRHHIELEKPLTDVTKE